MQWLKKLFDFYISSNLHVGLMGAIFVPVTYLYYGEDIEMKYFYFVFSSTLLSYILIRIFERITYDIKSCKALLQAFVSQLAKQSKIIVSLLLLSFIILVYFTYEIGLSHLWILLPAFFFTVGYVFPIIKYEGEWMNLRVYPKIKILSIALTWAITGVLFPLQEHLNDINVWICFIQRILLVMVLIIPFDIRDLENDASQLLTMPQSMGIDKSIKRGSLFLIFFLILEFFKNSLNNQKLVASIGVFVITMFLLHRSKENQSKYFASFWVEAVPLFWLIMVLLSQKI